MQRDCANLRAKPLIAIRSAQGMFRSVDDLALRVPELSRKDLVMLAQIGALNSIGDVAHRRDALWQVEQAGRPVGPLLRTAAAKKDRPGKNAFEANDNG